MANIKRRTAKEIEADFRRIKEAAKTAKNYSEIAKATGLTRQQINTTLAKHPTVTKRIEKLLTDNSNTTTKVSENSEITPDIIHEEKESTSDKIINYVIDASITATEGLIDTLNSLLSTPTAKFILTSISIIEIEKLQKAGGLTGKDARYIMALAAENADKFEAVMIDETVGIPDDCIIQYCKEHKDNVILLTGDKSMAVKARLHGVTANYFNNRDASQDEFCSRSAKE